MTEPSARDRRSSPPVVTIDGPAGSGKTTLGRRVAIALGLPLVDTGLLYRGVMVAALRAGLDASDPAAAARLVTDARIEINTTPDAADGDWTLRVDGEPADRVARDPANATLLARLSGLPEVRTALLPRQRAYAAGGAVAVGRDCGTVVFPDATLKIYLHASQEVRARRRAAQLVGGGTEVDERRLRDEVAGRDALDSGRAVSPLRPAKDAHIIDTGRNGIEEMVDKALRLCEDAGLLGAGGGGR